MQGRGLPETGIVLGFTPLLVLTPGPGLEDETPGPRIGVDPVHLPNQGKRFAEVFFRRRILRIFNLSNYLD